MATIRDDMIGAFNTFVQQQRQVPGECYLTFSQFDTEGYDVLYERKPLVQVPDLTAETFVPRGRTPLLDAVARTVIDQGNRFDGMPAVDKPEKVVFVIITDGQENASREFTYWAVKELLGRQQSQWGWTVLYLGANQDAIKVGADMGVPLQNALNYRAGKKGVANAYEALNAQIGSSRMGAQSVSFTVAQRGAAMEKDEDKTS